MVVTQGTVTVGDTIANTNNNIVGAPPAPYEDLPSYVCFSAGTLIETPTGARPIETLQVGDKVIVMGKEPQTIRWEGQRVLSAHDLRRNPKLFPVRITKDALGHGLPKRDILVSRQHRILASSKVVARMSGKKETLVAAIKLTPMPGIYVDKSVDQVIYHHLLFDEHEIVFSEGAPSESLHTGPEALKSVSDAAREEILTIFPHLKDRSFKPGTAREVLPNARQNRLIYRHKKNRKPLLELF